MARKPFRRCPKCKTNPIKAPSAKVCGACYRKRGGKYERATKPCPNPGCTNHIERSAKQCKTCYDNRGRTTPRQQLGDDPDRDRELERLKAENTRLKAGYRKAVKDEVEEERILALFERSVQRFPAIPKASLRPPSDRGSVSLTPEVPALLLGDQQIGEVINIHETRGINAYNFRIFQDRLEVLEHRVVDILTHHQNAPFEELVVFSMGDNVSGVIHEELQKGEHQHIVDQVYLGALATALFLYRLLVRLRDRGIRRLRVSCVSGNHGRLSKQKESKQYFRNFDYLFNNVVATALSATPEIEFFIPRSLFTVVDVAGHRILQSHGHELPPSSLGIPLYSINRASAGYQELLTWADGERFDYWLMGHFHRPMELDQAIVNGTMAGLGEYGIGRFKPTAASQKLIGFHQKWGKSWEYLLKLDRAPTGSVYTFDKDMATVDALEAFQDGQRAVT